MAHPAQQPARHRLVRVAETERPEVTFFIDGEAATALEGDTILTALLAARTHLRMSEFADGPRAGFCLMGACQDCWVGLETGERVRACTHYVEPGMRIVRPPE